MRYTIVLLHLVVCTVPCSLPGQQGGSSYAAMQSRSIKALSEQDVEALLAGEGMGFALAAELNGFPGPRHVIDLADSLDLSAEQLEQVMSVFERMARRAIELGEEIVGLERALDRAFARRGISPDALRVLTSQIASRTGELRAVHLGAHLEMDALLSQEQIMAYQRLRGYGHGEHVHPGGPN